MSKNVLDALIEDLAQISDTAKAATRLRRHIETSERTLADAERAASLLAAAIRMRQDELRLEKQKLSCSFCHRMEDQVSHLVAASNAAICEDCTEIVRKTIEENRPKGKGWRLFAGLTSIGKR